MIKLLFKCRQTKRFRLKNRLLGILFLCLLSGSLYGQNFTFGKGVLFSDADLIHLKGNITNEPWLTGYNALKNDARSRLNYTMKGPFQNVTRSPNLNNIEWLNDMVAIHNLTFMYVFTNDSAYARKATNILDSWARINTSWGGNESMLDIGDYIPYVVPAADILRRTFPGWSAANSANVERYFRDVLYPHSWVPGTLRDHNKGAIQLQIAIGIAAYLKDSVRLQQAIEVYRMDAGGGFRNSLPNGEVGDSGRDDHWWVQIQALGWSAEVAWNQGVDLFAEFDNRLLAMAELYHRYSQSPAGTITFIPFGGYSAYYTNWGIPTGIRRHSPFNNIIENAYARRKGIPTPYTTQMRNLVGENGWSFLYLKSSDSTQATPLTPIVYPADNALGVNSMSNIDIGNPGIAGELSYADGKWVVKGAGNSVASSLNYTFRRVKGDVGIIVKVESTSLSSSNCGVMLRESLEPNSRYYNIGIGGAGGVSTSHSKPKIPWWFKLERVGNRIFTYHSHDGVSWTNLAMTRQTYADSYIGFYTISNNTSAVNTATFSNVKITTGLPAGAPEITSATAAPGQLNTAFSYVVAATNSASVFRASGLPSGLNIDSLSGSISGIPLQAGKFAVNLEASNSTEAGYATLVIDVISDTAPAVPANVVATINNSTRIAVSWATVSNASSYAVKRSLSAEGPFVTLQDGLTSTSFIDTKPTPEVNNYYVITAQSGTLEGENSTVVFASVPPAIPTKPEVVNKPAQIDLKWENASGAITYKLKRGEISGGPYTTIATVSDTTYSDVNVTPETPYYYVVSSMGNTKESSNSPEAFGTAGTHSFTWSPVPLSDSLSRTGNWLENISPVNPAVLTFSSSADTVLLNDIAGLDVARMHFDESANAYTISGDTIRLRNDLVNTSSQSHTINSPVKLSEQLYVNTGIGDITINGVISGQGGITRSGSGDLLLTGANTYSGNTIINGTGGPWPPKQAIIVSGHGTGTQSSPTSGPLGTGKIIMNGGALYSGTDATLYNDIEIRNERRSYIFQTGAALNFRGRLLGNGIVEQDGNTFAGLHLYGDNSEFSGTFISKLRSGASRTRFETPQSGSAKASWLFDNTGGDTQSLQFATGTIHFGGLSGRGVIRCNATNGRPVMSVGARNSNTTYSGNIINVNGSKLQVEKVGTGTLIMSGNSTYSGNTIVKNGRLLINNNPSTGTFTSPVIVEEGIFGGTGRTSASVTVGTGAGTGAILEPGNSSVGSFITGALTLNSDANYTVDINPSDSTADKVTCTSLVLMNNPALTLTTTAGELQQGAAFTIIEATGSNAVSGIFRDLPEMSLVTVGAHNFRITYKGGTGNDVLLLDDRTVSPFISSALVDTTLAGKNYSYEVTTNIIPNSYAASGLPVGLNINTATGLISGIPTQAGTYAIALSAIDDIRTVTDTLNLIVQNSIVQGLIVASGDGKNIVEWDPLMNFAYNVKRSASSGGPYTTVAANLSTTKYTDAEVSNGSTYYYVVSTVENATELGTSAAVIATPNIGQMDLYTFEESDGSRLIDSWSAQHGTMRSSAIRSSGYNGQALQMDGTSNAYATLPTGIASNLTGDFTFATWVKMDALSSFMRIFDFGSSVNNTIYMTPQSAVNGGKSTIRFSIKLNGINQQVTYDYVWPLGGWTHVATTLSGNTLKLYVNGVLVGTNANVTYRASGLGNTANHYIGKSNGTTDPMFKGAVDEFRIYNRALNASEIAELQKAQQTISFNAISQKEVGDIDFNLSATASSGLPVSYTSSNTSVASIVDGKVHILAAGTSIITASQPGNTQYNAAASVTQTLTVNKKAQSITFAALETKTIGDADFDAAATASSGLAVSYSSSNESVATIVDGMVHIIGAGTTTIAASQEGDATFKSASAEQLLTVVKKTQAISFAAIASKKAGDADFSLAASATSGLPVSFSSSNESVATVVNGVIHILKAGTITLTASQAGNETYNSASATQTLTVQSFNLKVLSADGDYGQTANNVIRPNLKVVNDDSTSVNYDQLTARYWLTAENFAGVNIWIDYAQLGNSKVKTKYVALAQPGNNAFGYVEYSFDLSAGTLNAGANSGVIESRLANSDWSSFSESNDFSYKTGSSYSSNSNITLYRNGILVWGTEPELVTENQSVQVFTQRNNMGSSTISTYLKVENTGNVPVDYKDLSIRYFFTPESAANLNYWVDYAKLGNSKIQGQFVSVSPAVTGAATYFELKMDSSAGKLYPLSSTGNIQYRISKSDWSSFNESNDYSYLAGSFTENNHVCVYYKGQLIYGTEPTGSNNQLAYTNIPETLFNTNEASSTVIYPNPVVNNKFNVKTIASLLKKQVQLKLIDLSGHVVYVNSIQNDSGNIEVQLQQQIPAGVYTLLLNNQYVGKVIINQ